MGGMMQDKTPIYMMVIVGMVALVGIVVMLIGPSADSTGITGEVIAENTYYNAAASNAVSKVFFTLFLFGVAGYMYFKLE